jgi:hypothetical protein
VWNFIYFSHYTRYDYYDEVKSTVKISVSKYEDSSIVCVVIGCELSGQGLNSSKESSKIVPAAN